MKILGLLYKREQISDQIELKCRNHDSVTIIREQRDFGKVPEGGCKEICNARLQCGHSCGQFCHPFVISDNDKTGHKQKKCTKKCQAKLKCGHICQYICYQCKKGHKDCKAMIQHSFQCGHTVETQCFKRQQLKCESQCEKYLKCGHKCLRICYVQCQKLYQNEIKKGFFSPCKQLINKKLPCGHTIPVQCGRSPEKFDEKQGCSQICRIKLPCGHTKNLTCKQIREKKYEQLGCSSPCNQPLECGHNCPKKCKDCFQKLFHGQCEKKCGRNLFCNHACEASCGDCPPCQLKCPIKCSHSQCVMKCGEKCVPCKEPCQRGCRHQKCNKQCGQQCDIKPCNIPCDQMLKCKHSCIGFCGQKCPQICRICNKDDQTFQIFFGNQDNQDARFVLLQDCGHYIQDSALAKIMEDDEESKQDSEIQYKRCPKCTTRILNCSRYSNAIIRTTRDVNKLKQIQLQQIKQNSQIVRKEVSFKKLKQLQAILIDTFRGKENQEYKIYQQAINDLQKNVKKILNYEIKSCEELQTVADKYNLVSSFTQQIIKLHSDNFNDNITMDISRAEKLMRPFFQQLQNPRIHETRRGKLRQMIQAFKGLCSLFKTKPNNRGQQLTQIQQLIKELITSKLLITNPKQHQQIMRRVEQLSKQSIMELHKQIREAIGLSGRHWYKCPNGHFYAIGECGGAMQRGKCPQCNADIGGQSHQLAQGNQHAGQFDGSLQAAYDGGNIELNERVARRMQAQIDQVWHFDL